MLTTSVLAQAFRTSAPEEPLDPGPRASRWQGPTLDVTLPLRVANVPVATIVRDVLYSADAHRRPDGSATSIPLRSVPSAGAMHPVTAHVLVGRNCDLAPGLYAFDPVSGAFFRRSSPVRPSPALPTGARVVLTVRPQRAYARYGSCAPPLLITETALTLTWLATVCANRGVRAVWRSDVLTDPHFVGLPTYADWHGHWPETAAEIALATFDMGSEGAAPNALDALAHALTNPSDAAQSPSAPMVATGHTCRVFDELSEDTFAHQLTEGACHLPAVPTKLDDRRSAPYEAFSPQTHGRSVRIDADFPLAGAPHATACQLTRRTIDRTRAGGDGAPLGDGRELHEQCSHQQFVTQAPSVVVWTADTADLAVPDVHWAAGFDAARLTLAAHRGEIPGFSRTRLIGGWQHRAPHGDATALPILGLAFAADTTQAASTHVRRLIWEDPS